MIKYMLCVILLLLTTMSHARDLRGRLGVGANNQLKNDIPAVSVKIQRSAAYALGAVLGTRFSDRNGGYGAGLKFYRIIFDEPQLNFYFSTMAALLNTSNNGASSGGFQIDAGFGTEFHFTGLESLGFSFEFGMSANKLNNTFSLETVGSHFVAAAIHFYL